MSNIASENLVNNPTNASDDRIIYKIADANTLIMDTLDSVGVTLDLVIQSVQPDRWWSAIHITDTLLRKVAPSDYNILTTPAPTQALEEYRKEVYQGLIIDVSDHINDILHPISLKKFFSLQKSTTDCISPEDQDRVLAAEFFINYHDFKSIMNLFVHHPVLFDIFETAVWRMLADTGIDGQEFYTIPTDNFYPESGVMEELLNEIPGLRLEAEFRSSQQSFMDTAEINPPYPVLIIDQSIIQRYLHRDASPVHIADIRAMLLPEVADTPVWKRRQ